jgi:hypothetical protein
VGVVEVPSQKLEKTKSPAERASEINAGLELLTPYWPKWRCYQFDYVDLNVAVALSCNISPDLFFVDRDEADSPFEDDDTTEYDLRMSIARDLLADAPGTKRVPERDGSTAIRVRLGFFVSWVIRMRKQSAEVWQGLQPEFLALETEAPPPSWPWATGYTTPKLNALNEAVKHFWADYREGDPPKEEHGTTDVILFLTKTLKTPVGNKAAQAIDNIIRPPSWEGGLIEGKGFPKKKRNECSR